MGETHFRFAKMDNAELLWWMKSFVNTLDLRIDSNADAMFHAIEDRLYPEYDGENVTWSETGWDTPEGPVDYVTNA